MCENSNVNLVENLREARRRKILENSAKRLKLIEGINSSPGKCSSETYLEPKPEPEVKKTVNLWEETGSSDLNSKLNDVRNVREELKEISDYLLFNKNNVCEEDVLGKEEEEEDVGVENLEQRNVLFKIFLKKKLHYVLLALSVNILLFFNFGFLFYENIFCPFYTVKIIELLLLRTGEKEDFQLLSSLFLVSVPKGIKKFSGVLTLLVNILSDLCVYLYTFIIATKFIN